MDRCVCAVYSTTPKRMNMVNSDTLKIVFIIITLQGDDDDDDAASIFFETKVLIHIVSICVLKENITVKWKQASKSLILVLTYLHTIPAAEVYPFCIYLSSMNSV